METGVYFIAAKKAGAVVRGKLPLTAREALAFLERAIAKHVEIRDQHDRQVSVQQLRQEAVG
jgi:hypothetical protein